LIILFVQSQNIMIVTLLHTRMCMPVQFQEAISEDQGSKTICTSIYSSFIWKSFLCMALLCTYVNRCLLILKLTNSSALNIYRNHLWN